VKRHITAFYLETLLLILVFIAIILVLTQIFGMSKERSTQARLLTNAVCLAENAAEAVSASDSPEKLQELLDQDGNTSLREDGWIRALYDLDMTPDRDGNLSVAISWDPAGELVNSRILVKRLDTDQELYSLNTAVYLREVGP